jgi:hypothetical protein
MSPAAIEAGIAEIETWFQNFLADRAARKEAFRAKALAHLEAGGIVREWFGSPTAPPTDWPLRYAKQAPDYAWIANHLANRLDGGMAADHEFLPASAPAWVPPKPEGAMDYAEVLAWATAHGYTHVMVLGEDLQPVPRPLDGWKPYGMGPGEIERWFATEHDASHVIDTPWMVGTEPFGLGVWEFTTLGTPA